MSYKKPLTNRQRKSQKKRLSWLASATRWRRVGTESFEDEVLITRVRRKPPMYTLEHVNDEGQVNKALLIKAPKGEKGYHVQLTEDYGFYAKTRRKAILAFAGLGEAIKGADSEALPASEDSPGATL